ncbi:unnamed protein product [Amoebophrya sp. A25]|nr:unnamed protein product [Amoebophrya sp. A25]|eukprot:GSA25T00005438001.1
MPPKLKLASPELEAIVSNPDNQECADCDARAPRWASVNLGCLVCIDCAGIHRHLGVHISVMKSVTLDKWQAKWLETVGQIGNRRSNSYFEFRLQNGKKPTGQSSMEQKRSFIIAKYERKEFIPRGNEPSPSELLAQGRSPDAYLSGSSAGGGGATNGGGFSGSSGNTVQLAGTTAGGKIQTSLSVAKNAGSGTASTASSSNNATPPMNLLDDDFGFTSTSNSNSATPAASSFDADFAPFASGSGNTSLEDMFSTSVGGGNDFTAFASFSGSSAPATGAGTASNGNPFPATSSIMPQVPMGGGAATSSSANGGFGDFASGAATSSSSQPAAKAVDKFSSFNDSLANLYQSGTANSNRGNVDALASMGGMNMNMGGAPGGMGNMMAGNGFPGSMGASGMMGGPMGGSQPMGSQPMMGGGQNLMMQGNSAQSIIMGGVATSGSSGGNPFASPPPGMIAGGQQMQQNGFGGGTMNGMGGAMMGNNGMGSMGGAGGNMMGMGNNAPMGNPFGQAPQQVGFPGGFNNGNMMGGGNGLGNGGGQMGNGMVGNGTGNNMFGQQPAMQQGGMGGFMAGPQQANGFGAKPAKAGGGLDDLISGTVTSQYMNQFPGTPKNKASKSPTGGGAGSLADLDPFSVM